MRAMVSVLKGDDDEIVTNVVALSGLNWMDKEAGIRLNRTTLRDEGLQCSADRLSHQYTAENKLTTMNWTEVKSIMSKKKIWIIRDI